MNTIRADDEVVEDLARLRYLAAEHHAPVGEAVADLALDFEHLAVVFSRLL